MTTASIKIVNFERPPVVLWEKSLHSEAEYGAVKKMCLSGGREVSVMHCLLYPARTNTLRNFAQDCFFPLLYHDASRASSCAQRVIENLVYFLIDLLTLPIRVITCIPRAIYNAYQKEHALLSYLKNNGIDKQFINTDRVRVNLEAKFGEDSTFVETNWDGEEYRVFSQSGELTVHFAVDVPEMIGRGGLWWSTRCKKKKLVAAN